MHRSQSFSQSFEKEFPYWKINEKSLTEYDSLSTKAFEFREGQEWGLSFEIPFASLSLNENDLIDVSLDVISNSNNDDLLIVSEIIDSAEKIDWRASKSSEFRIDETE